VPDEAEGGAARRCANCGGPLTEFATRCPACETPVDPANPGSSFTVPGTGEASVHAVAQELVRRGARLRQWAEAAAPLGVALPELPVWIEDAARATAEPDPWVDVARGAERIAQKRLLSALEGWERRIRTRLARLEAYSVDSRLERDQVDDIVHAGRAGELSRALAGYQQVERVVALKERHLDQAREELERLVSLLRDLEALGLPIPQSAADLEEELERELRRGRLVSLKQQLRALRQQAMDRMRSSVPVYVSRYGDYLLSAKRDGLPVDAEIAQLAAAAREFSQGRPEDSLRRLRLLVQLHGAGVSVSSGAAGDGAEPPARTDASARPAGVEPPTESARTA
jgi:hypothetical protein